MRQNSKRYPALGPGPEVQISVPGLPQGSGQSDCWGFHIVLQGAHLHSGAQARAGDLISFCAYFSGGTRPEWDSSSPEGPA